MALKRSSITFREENALAGIGSVRVGRYFVTVTDAGVNHELSFDHSPTDDEISAAVGVPATLLAPTLTAGKAALKDLLNAQIAEAQAWDWFNVKAQADAGIPVLAKTAIQALTTAEYTEAKRLANEWRQAV